MIQRFIMRMAVSQLRDVTLLSVLTIFEGEFQAVTDGMVGGDLPVEAGRD